MNFGETRIDESAPVGALREGAQDKTSETHSGTIAVYRDRPSEIPRSPSTQFRYIIGAFIAAALLHLALLIAVNL